MARRENAPKPVEGITPKWAEGLTHRERRFVEHYLVDLNATRAMVRLGPEVTTESGGYANNDSACVAGMQYLAKAHVAKAIEIALNEVGVTRLWIINELAKLVRADLSQFMTITGGEVKVFDLDDVPKELHPLLSEVYQDFDKDGNATGIRVKLLHDRPALRYLAKLLRMEVERQEISGPDGGPIAMESPRERLKARMDELAKRLAASEKPAEGPADGA